MLNSTNERWYKPLTIKIQIFRYSKQYSYRNVTFPMFHTNKYVETITWTHLFEMMIKITACVCVLIHSQPNALTFSRYWKVFLFGGSIGWSRLNIGRLFLFSFGFRSVDIVDIVDVFFYEWMKWTDSLRCRTHSTNVPEKVYIYIYDQCPYYNIKYRCVCDGEYIDKLEELTFHLFIFNSYHFLRSTFMITFRIWFNIQFVYVYIHLLLLAQNHTCFSRVSLKPKKYYILFICILPPRVIRLITFLCRAHITSRIFSIMQLSCGIDIA